MMFDACYCNPPEPLYQHVTYLSEMIFLAAEREVRQP